MTYAALYDPAALAELAALLGLSCEDLAEALWREAGAEMGCFG